MKMDYTALPITPEFSPEAARVRSSQLLNKSVNVSTFRRWRRETGLNKGWLTEKEVWMLSVYGQCLSIYRCSKSALDEANKIIEDALNGQSTAA